MKFFNHGKGFSLIELLIVVSVIGILAAIAIPGFLGMQERSRRGAVTRAASTSEPQLQAWLNSALRGVGAGFRGALIEVDSNGDGVLGTFGGNADANNSSLGSWLNAGNLGSAYISAKQALGSELSPWYPVNSLWLSGETMGGIDVTNTSDSPFSMTVRAYDKNGYQFHSKTLYSD